MDFLDPRRKRASSIRLIIGYLLVAIVIGLSTIILVYGAYGYGINTKTGQIIQNGLLFVNSRPGGAEIFLNGQDKGVATSARLVLPADNYSLTLKRSGYHDWQRSFNLDEHTIVRYTYPFLLPLKPQVTALKAYNSMPPLLLSSPDRHWLLVQTAQDSAKNITFDQYDTGALTKAPASLTLPASLLADSGQSASLSLLDWADDNNNVLLKHTYSGGYEYIVFNRDKPGDSFNVNKLLGVAPSAVYMRNQKVDQLYIYDQAAGTVRLADIAKASLADPILSQVLAFKPYGSDLASYVTDKGMPAGQVEARIWNSGKTYSLYKFKAGTVYLIDAGQYQGHWYYAAGSNTDPRIDIFKDPLDGLKNPSVAKAVPLLALNQPAASRLSFSTNYRFIEADSGQAYAVYDTETASSYSYSIKVALVAPLSPMDGNHLIGQSSGQVLIMDYDSLNHQLLTNTSQSDGGFLSRDLNHLLTILENKTNSTFELLNVDLRAGTDLPKTP